MLMKMDGFRLEDILSVYFSRLFPYHDFYRWLNYGDANTFATREFALNFQGDRFLRHQSYSSIDELRNSIKKLRPVKIDIGAVYNIPPSKHMQETEFYPIQKELIFDLDISDYDEVRVCCSGADICLKCWKFLVIAMKILDAALREDFGFANILWVFSGRRGVHCWVCDERARFLKKGGRYAVANYLQLIHGGDYKKKKVEINNNIHHSVKRALKFIEPLFVQLCVIEQNMLGTEERILKFLGIIEEEMRTEVNNLLNQYETSLDRWTAFENFFRSEIELESEKWCKTPFLIEEIVLQYSYPRLDIHVSLGLSHLLKSPFCVHPKNGKICIPIDPKNVEHFNPHKVPTILKIMDEIDNFDAKAKKQGMSFSELKNIEDIKKTSLYESLCVFRAFLEVLETIQTT